ncbi:MAG: hypothetical protein KDC45_10460 [Bacteroidetes bacterium]|nr:hypothetical protein [Bacteroidota bacterium]
MDVNLKEIAAAMEDNRLYAEFYLNKSDGKVTRISRDILDAVEDDDPESVPDMAKNAAQIAEAIMFDPKCTMIQVPNLSFAEQLRLMTTFYTQVKDKELSKKLEAMRKSRNPTLRLLEALKDYPDEMKKWNDYKESFYVEEASKWVKSLSLN